MLNDAAAAPPRAASDSLFGHPKGLYFLAFTETWERFSYYGMTALVVLYMVNQLLLPGHVEHIAGFASFRAALESVSGPLSPQALASQLFGLYAGFVYFTPLLGGIIADRWLGQRTAVVIGALAMFAGHVAMAFDASFLLALLLLVLGSGLLKGNISAQVGALYPTVDEVRRARGFVVFSTGINIGAVLGPIVCGLLAQLYGWHVGFGAAAIFMLAGLGVYLSGYRHLPARVTRGAAQQQPLTAADWRVMRALVVVIVISILPVIAYTQHFNVLPVWIQAHVSLDVGRWRIPVPWFQSIDSFTSVLSAAPLLWLWQWQTRRGGGPGDIDKIAMGSWIGAGSNLMLSGAIYASGGRLLHPIWPFLYCVGLGIAFMHYWPALLALVSRVAPARVNSTMMGFVFINLFVGTLLVGWIGGRYERMSPMDFWLLHAAIGAAGGIVLMVCGRALAQAVRPTG
ncbi:MAG: peptide MFS transporter [Proteobacteria bacterium]|nr:peptide MFS transporter [Pseudomonadota bacterium]